MNQLRCPQVYLLTKLQLNQAFELNGSRGQRQHCFFSPYFSKKEGTKISFFQLIDWAGFWVFVHSPTQKRCKKFIKAASITNIIEVFKFFVCNYGFLRNLQEFL